MCTHFFYNYAKSSTLAEVLRPILGNCYKNEYIFQIYSTWLLPQHVLSTPTVLAILEVHVTLVVQILVTNVGTRSMATGKFIQVLMIILVRLFQEHEHLVR